MKTAYGEFRILTLRETTPNTIADQPQKAADYWREHIAPTIDSEKEYTVVLLLNTRLRVTGHTIVSMGSLNSCVIEPREVFRPAVIAAAHGIVIMHNHPSGDPTPSEADGRVTRTLLQAAKILRIELLDHVVMGSDKHCSLRQLGMINPNL